ncbi:MAG: DUF503 domain-containing protein [Acidimicrobiales bacterium]
MQAGVLTIELVIDSSRSLKDKRAVVRHLLDTARRRFAVSASEVGHHDKWQRAELGFAVVAADAAHVTEVLDAVERFVWAHPEIEVTATERHWVESDR